jgi:AbrB family looped-hinge helix DNA binding protein
MNAQGQVTLPREIRERMGLEPGDMVEFAPGPGRTLVLHLRSQRVRVLGALHRGAVTREEMNVLLAGDASMPARTGTSP